jgi:hypothetical protein
MTTQEQEALTAELEEIIASYKDAVNQYTEDSYSHWLDDDSLDYSLRGVESFKIFDQTK